MSEVPETELPEPHNDPFRGRCAMLVSALAMVLAIAGLGVTMPQKKVRSTISWQPMHTPFTKPKIFAKPNTKLLQTTCSSNWRKKN